MFSSQTNIKNQTQSKQRKEHPELHYHLNRTQNLKERSLNPNQISEQEHRALIQFSLLCYLPQESKICFFRYAKNYRGNHDNMCEINMLRRMYKVLFIECERDSYLTIGGDIRHLFRGIIRYAFLGCFKHFLLLINLI